MTAALDPLLADESSPEIEPLTPLVIETLLVVMAGVEALLLGVRVSWMIAPGCGVMVPML